MKRLFGDDAKQITDIYITDWTQEVYTSIAEDHKPMAAHPDYGFDAKVYDDRLIFTGTETAYKEGGYLEGCIIAIDSILKRWEEVSQ